MAAQLGLAKTATLFRGAGCPACKQSGYKGRVGIFELLAMTEIVKEQIVARAPAHAIRRSSLDAGLRTLRDDGLAKARQGVTTVEEVLRVTQLE